MNKEEFLQWKSNQVYYLSKFRSGRWFQNKFRKLYTWVLKD